MSRLGKEWEVKLELLQSIARSQEALARMLNSVAEITGRSEPSAAVLREHVATLTRLQGALLGSVAGIGWRPPTDGVPAPPWLSDAVSAPWPQVAGGEREVAGA